MRHIFQALCKEHGITDFVYESLDSGIKQRRCLKCRSKSVIKWRRRRKQQLMDLKGGKCALCGYNKCAAALDFHHLDPTQKEFGLSQRGLTRSFEVLKQEVDKCILLCANCHREVEHGITIIAR